MEYKEFTAQLQEQLKPIIDDLRELKETMGSTMHPETGIYPKIKDARDLANAAFNKIDKLREESATKQNIIDVTREINYLKEKEEKRSRTRVWALRLFLGGMIGSAGAGAYAFLF